MSHPVECTIRFAAPGRQLGRLEIPKSTNRGGWAHQFIPMACVARGEGPTALVLGGNHGDEYEGQVAGLKLLRELRPEQVRGRVIVIPCLSPEASRAGTRLWPNGVNFNRSFPGRVDGPANELRHAGILEGEVVRRDPPAVILDGRDVRNYVFAPESGIFETLVDPTDAVRAGDVVGRIHSLEHPARAPAEIVAPLDGVTASVRAISWTEQGDNVLVFGQPISAEAVL